MLFLFTIATSAFAAYSGTVTPDTRGATSYDVTDYAPGEGDNADNTIGNANNTGGENSDSGGVMANDGTGVNDAIKSMNMRMTDLTGGTGKTQRTHGEYQNNTNSCASCHQTHTGAAKDLLFKSSVYNTCTACHDGTLGFYNVYSASTAGTFGGTVAGNASVHMAQGYMDHNLAPGGNFAKTGSMNGSWGEKFDCASCHAPHGSYSDRLLHYNPNNMANVSIANQGQKLVSMSVYTGIPTVTDAGGADFIVARTVSDAAYVEVTQEDFGTPVIVVMKKDGKIYKRDKTIGIALPWLYGYDMDDNHNKINYTQLKDSAGKEITTGLEIEYGFGYAKGTALNNVASADIGRCYVTKLQGNQISTKNADGSSVTVDMPMTEIKDFGGVKITKVNPDIYDEAGYGVAIGKYCGACHTDYRASSGKGTGMYSVAFRHTTNNDRYTCLKCHYAHGTDVTVMLDANDRSVASLGGSAIATEYLLDKNPSSALKRYTNMAVCWKCHTDSKAAQLKQNNYFWDNYGSVPHGGATGLITSEQHQW